MYTDTADFSFPRSFGVRSLFLRCDLVCASLHRIRKQRIFDGFFLDSKLTHSENDSTNANNHAQITPNMTKANQKTHFRFDKYAN